MSLSRNLFVAAGAGIAGLSLGLVMGHAAPASTAQASTAPGEPAPAGAYMIVMGTVHDRPAFGAGYAAELPPLYARHGGEYLAVTGSVETLEGETGFQSLVLSRWPDADAARAFWADPEYRELAERRIENAWGDFHVVLVEALPAPAQETEMAREARGGE